MALYTLGKQECKGTMTFIVTKETKKISDMNNNKGIYYKDNDTMKRRKGKESKQRTEKVREHFNGKQYSKNTKQTSNVNRKIMYKKKILLE